MFKILKAAVARIRFGMRSELFKGHRLEMISLVFSEYHEWDEEEWKKNIY